MLNSGYKRDIYIYITLNQVPNTPGMGGKMWNPPTGVLREDHDFPAMSVTGG